VECELGGSLARKDDLSMSANLWRFALMACLVAFPVCSIGGQQRPEETTFAELPKDLHWHTGPPFLAIDPARLPPSPENPWHAVKDPSIVRFQDKWHLFCTLRKTRGADGKPPGYIRIGYLSFADWPDALTASWHLLDFAKMGPDLSAGGSGPGDCLRALLFADRSAGRPGVVDAAATVVRDATAHGLRLARFLDHLRRHACPSVFHVPQWQIMASRHKTSRLPARIQ
jgi:hypothetical protein